MTLKFRCALCGQPQGVQAEKAGASIFCLHCSAETPVPAASDVELGGWADVAGDSFAAESWMLTPPASQPHSDQLAASAVAMPAEESSPRSLPFSSSPPLTLSPSPVPVASETPADLTPVGAGASKGSRNRRARWFAAALLLLLIGVPIGYVSTFDWRAEDEPGRELLFNLVDTQVFEDKLFAMGMPIDLSGGWPMAPLLEPESGPGETYVFPPLVFASGGGAGGGRGGSGGGRGGSGGGSSSSGTVVKPPEVVPDPPMPEPEEARTRLSDKELFLEAVKAGDDFMKTKNFEQATAWYKIAGEIHTTPDLLEALKRAEQSRLEELQRVTETRRAAEEYKKFVLFERLMIKGNGDLVMKSYDTARKVFEEAAKLFPNDRRVQGLLNRANYLKAQQDQENQLSDEDKKLALERKATRDYKLFGAEIEAGRSALQRQDYRAALVHFLAARELQPGNTEAYENWLRSKRQLADQIYEKERDDLKRLQAKQAQQQAEADKLKLLAYDRYYTEGLQLSKQGKFELARLAFQQALDVRPGDKEALERRAESDAMGKQALLVQEKKAKEQADQARREAAEAARRAEELKRAIAEREAKEASERLQTQYKQALTQGYLLLAQGKFDDAEAAVAQAGKLMPMDVDPGRLLKAIGDARTERQQLAELARKRDEELQQAKDDAQKRRLLNEQRLQAETEERNQALRREQASNYVLADIQTAVTSGQYGAASMQVDVLLAANPDRKDLPQLKEQAEAGRRQIEADRALARERDAAQLNQFNADRRRNEEADAAAQARWNAQQDDKRRREALDGKLQAAHFARTKGDFAQAMSLFQEAAALGGDKQKIDQLILETKGQQAQRSQWNEIQARESQLAQAGKAQAALDRDAKQAALDNQQRVQRQNQQAKLALERNDYDGAYALFEQSARIAPGNAEAQAGLKRARQGQDLAIDKARKDVEAKPAVFIDEAEQNRLRKAAAYDSAMKAGRSSLSRKSYDLAARMFRMALDNLPGDAEATNGLAQAAQARDEEQRALGLAAEEAKRRLQEKHEQIEASKRELARVETEAADLHALKRKQNAELLDNLVVTARACLDLHRWDAAARALAQAAAIAPNDPRIRRMQATLDDMQRPDAAAAPAPAANASNLLPLSKSDEQAVRRATVELHVEEARRYLDNGLPAQAIQSAKAALALQSDHSVARQLLQSAEAKK